jgi:hypothetical protein
MNFTLPIEPKVAESIQNYPMGQTRNPKSAKTPYNPGNRVYYPTTMSMCFDVIGSNPETTPIYSIKPI